MWVRVGGMVDWIFMLVGLCQDRQSKFIPFVGQVGVGIKY